MMTVKCPRCNEDDAIIHSKWGVLPCQSCQDLEMPLNIGRPPEFATNSQGERVRNERDTHSKDIIQPFIGTKVNEEFARAYPGKINDNFDRNTLQSL